MSSSVLDASAKDTFGKGYAPGQEGGMKLFSGPAERNCGPILEVLETIMPKVPGKVLAIAEGSGQHVSAFAKAFPHMKFLPTEIEPAAIQSQKIYIEEAQVSNILPPQMFDCITPTWENVENGLEKYSLIYTVNLTHISPFEATLGLFLAAKRLLEAGGILLIYGPFKVNGAFTSEGNEQFDKSLRARNEKFGYRDIKELEQAADKVGLTLEKVLDVPANNHILIFKSRQT